MQKIAGYRGLLAVRAKPFPCLAAAEEILKFLQLRNQVFVVEQKCIYQDIDEHDVKAWHVLCYNDNEMQLIGYARIILPTQEGKAISFGRFAIDKSHRGQGLGKMLLQQKS